MSKVMKDGEEVKVYYKGTLVTRKDAKALGLKNYFTGKPCKFSHIEQRQTCSGQCNECKRQRTRAWRNKPEDEKYLDNKVAKILPPQKQLLDTLIYDKLNGKLFWKDRPQRPTETKRSYKAWRTRWLGKEAGARHYANGYLEIRVETKELHKAHRIIWKMVTGEDPDYAIDHVNGIPWDNRWDNLRLATNQENARNSVTYSRSGYKGVTKSEDETLWSVCWCIDDINYNKTGFSSPEEAARYYDDQVKEIYKEFAKLNFPENRGEK